MKKIEESLKSFEEYKLFFKDYIKEDLSESDTRSKLIDKMFIDVLGWDEKDIKRESKVENGYYDYRISIPGINFLIEAKRQFKEFTIPANHKITSIKILLKQNEEVISQIRSYSMDEGIPCGVITNGFQFIVLKTFNTDGKFWKDNSALIFSDISDIDKRFIEFYENLSKFSVINNGGFKYDLPFEKFEGKKVLSTIIDRDKELIRNSLSGVLTPLVDKAFGEMFSEQRDDDLEFIRQCFVENSETKKNKNEIERLFGDDAPEMTNLIPIVNSNNLANAIVDEIENDEINIKITYPPNPIILIGSKGSGKTTFINHLFKYKVEKDEIENHFVIYIDFRRFFESDSNFEPSAIANEVLESIYNKYNSLELHSLKTLIRIYITQIKRNDESIWLFDKKNNETSYQNKLSSFLEEAKKDSLKHLVSLSHYLIRERRKRLIIIIDNADQFNDLVQEKLFVFSHSLTKSSFCGTVISLREGYFRKWQNSPPFDAYESNIYHVTAPKFIDIIQRRIDFAIFKNNQSQKKTILAYEEGKELEVSSNYIDTFLKGLKNSLFAIGHSALIDFVSLTTFPNIREGLRIIKIFLNSGHTKISEYIEREKQRETTKAVYPVIPLHEFIKSIALQNRHYYNSDTSVINNLLIPAIESDDHFFKIYILKDFAQLIENDGHYEKYISNTSIIDKFTSLGYRPNTINSALSYLLSTSMLDTDEQLSDVEWTNLPSSYNITLTAKGYYYLKFLITRFHYYDLISQDTPIFDEKFYTEMISNFPISSKEGVRNFELRKEFIRIFFDYLEHKESIQPNQIRTVYGSIVKELKSHVLQEINM